MPHLIGANNQKIGLIPGTTIVGRDASQCQIVLEQPFISRLQAAIEVNQNGQVALKNLSVKKTTFLNGQQVDVCILQNGDKIEFGAGQMLTFIFHGEPVQRPTAPAFSFAPAPHRPGAGEATQYRHAQAEEATSVFHVAPSSRLRIGRAVDNDIVLDAPSVSRYHAELLYDQGQQPVITDLGSTNGIFVNGEFLRSAHRLAVTDWVGIGGYLLSVNGREIKKQDLSASRVVAYNVGKKYGDRAVLQDVSFALYPREFVGLMGASGCGKSTLMDALNGMRPADSGSVFINDMDLYQNFDLLRRSIGYVPQRDILHEALTVERTLYYAARMRLPGSTSAAQIEVVINEVIQTVGLEEQRGNAFRQLSGGQQKRLSLGIELITKPSFLFLDEPTSPLDPESTENMMLLFRRLADEGRIVVMVTHKFEKFNSMHHIALLTKGGRLAYFGPPNEAMQYFNCQEPGEIYRRLSERTPEELSRTFSSSRSFQKYVASRFNEMQEFANRSGGLSGGAGITNTGAERKFGIGQWWTLTQRYLEIKLKDQRNTLLMLAQAPLVSLILAFITNNTANDGRTIFIAAIISIWLGANNAIREIVSEKEVYSRERLVNLKIPSYVMSKFVILSGIGLIQCFLFVVIQVAFGKFATGDLPMLTLILYLSLLAGVAIGLFFSALVNSTEKAMSILPLILIPQLLLSGFLKPLDDIYVNVAEKEPVPVNISVYDKYKRDEKEGRKIDPNNPSAIPPVVTKQKGMEVEQIAAEIMPARWTIDALAHQVSIYDKNARGKLATQMTVQEYSNMLDNKYSAAEITDAYESRVRLDLMILGIFSILFLGLTMFAMKRKDSL